MEIANLTGQFLIAMPAMGDPNFERTVTLLCRYSDDGALGLVINRQAEMTMGDLFRQMELPFEGDAFDQQSLHYGGPVQQERGFVIHESSNSWDSTLQISDDLAITTSRDILEAISRHEGPEKYMVALGYAGWGETQLEQEILENAWLTCPADPRIIFETDLAQRWKQATQLMGIDISHLSNDAGHS